MASSYLRLAIGVVLMAAVCLTAWRIGDRPVRLPALIVAAAWAVATAGEVLIQRQAEPVIHGDAIAALGMLRLAWTYHRRWLWLAICIEAALFFLHAIYYLPPALIPLRERLANNALNTAGLAVILAAALISGQRRRGVSAASRHGAVQG